MGNKLEHSIIREDTQMVNKHMKSLLTSLASRETQIKTTMKYQHTSSRITKK